jgi:hypothetical protein
MSSYIVAMGDRVQHVERLRVRVAVYQMIGLLRGTLQSWRQFKTSRLEYTLRLIEEQMARLPRLDY